MSKYTPTADQRDAIEDALLDYGNEREDAAYSSRARSNFDDAVDAIVAVLADARREGQAEAWEIGRSAGVADAARIGPHGITRSPNPYRSVDL